MKIKWKPRFGRDFESTTVESGKTSVKIENLLPKVLYDIEITTLCQESVAKCGSKSSRSTMVSAHTTAVPPHQVKVLEIYNKAVKVYWKYNANSTSEVKEFVEISLHTEK